MKECSIQENGGYRNVCAGLDNGQIMGEERSCSVILDNVRVEDHGQYMCLLNQADVFHTDRGYNLLKFGSLSEKVLT